MNRERGDGRLRRVRSAQAIAPGTFVKMPVHAEEMYDPDIYGKGVPSTLRVQDE